MATKGDQKREEKGWFGRIPSKRGGGDGGMGRQEEQGLLPPPGIVKREGVQAKRGEEHST